MKELIGNMLEIPAQVLVVTTNGFVKSNGECVMGKGIAKQIAELDSTIPYELGKLIKEKGNNVHYITSLNGVNIVSFPVKPITVINDGTNVVKHMAHQFKIGDSVPGWAAKADINIIERSLQQLQELINKNEWVDTVITPRFGCGAGELDWSDIKPLAEKYLDDRFTVCTFK